MRRFEIAERQGWQARVEAVGFDFHTPDGQRYWDERAAYAFTLQEIERDLEAPTAELEAMCLEFAADAVSSEAILSRLAIPKAVWPTIRESWQRGDRNLYGRFDLAYDGTSPAKMLEYNADTPTALLETGVAQWVWLEEQVAAGALPKGSDQFNSVHERLVAAFKGVTRGQPRRLHLACADGSAEDLGTVRYLEECARQAGHEVSRLFMNEIGLTKGGKFVDGEDVPIEVLFKLYPWEWMFGEEYASALGGCGVQFIEPPWKAVLSTKGLLPLLHERHPGHPNLLPAFFGDDPRAAGLKHHVRKPLYSREGANISVVSGGETSLSTKGPYGEEGYVVQEAALIPRFDGNYAVIGSWVIASDPAGICVREDSGPVTRNTSRFVPHIIEA
jgi:glutathionylspermidine synthase